MTNQARIFLYLGKRDKKGMKLLSIFPYRECPPTKISDVGSLKLPEDMQLGIENTLREHGLGWEIWMESASGYKELIDSLHSRGYKKLPAYCTPLHVPNLKSMVVKSPTNPISPDVNSIGPQKKGMLRRGNKKPS